MISEAKRAYMKQWRSANKERIRANQIAYLAAKRERLLKQERKHLLPIMAELVARRRACGLTQLELARRSGYANNHICNWERGHKRIYLHQAQDIANAMGLRITIAGAESGK